MGRYVARRLFQAVPVFVGILVLTFVLIHAAPGDPVTIFAGQSGDAAYYAEMRAKFGLDRSLPEQLVVYFAEIAKGDFGFSYAHRRPVFEIIADRIPATALLMLTALLVSTTVGIGLAILATRRRGRLADHLVTLGTLLGAATPAFWLGQVLVLVFAWKLGVFPVEGMSSARPVAPGLPTAFDIAAHLVLPAVTLGVLQLALVTRLARSGLEEEMREDYVRTATAKGLPPGTVVRRHALPNALLPVITVVGGQFGTLLTGAVLTEIIFAWPGLGRLLYDATLARDYPLVMGMFIVASASVILANLVTDLAYARLDPRVHLR